MKKALPLLLLLLFGAGNAFSQTFNWSRQVAANGEDGGYAVSTDKARNSYVTGSFIGTLTFPTGCGTYTSFNNFPDIYIAKFDPNGVCLWAKQYGGGGPWGSDEGLSISVDGVGNSYVTGHFTATATFGSQSLVSQGLNDIFIVKHSPNGTLQWVVRGGGAGPGDSGSDSGFGIAIGTNLYVTGNAATSPAANVTFDSTLGAPCTLPNSSSQGMFIVSYTPAGVCQVAKRAGGVGRSISVDGAGYIYIIGDFTGPSATFGNLTVTGSTAHLNTFIVKYHPMLSVQWVRTVKGYVRSHSISTDSQGNSYIAGDFVGTATFPGLISITSTGYSDAFIAKYNASGGFKWARRMGASVTAVANSISVRETCDLSVTGSFMGTINFGGLTPLTSAGSSDIFVARYDTNGVSQWALAAGGSLEDAGHGISVDSFGKVSVTGVYRSNPAMFAGAGPDLINTNTFARNSFVAKASP
jgi:hypothetical protein